MEHRKRVVFLGYLTGFGGAEKSMTNIANGLSQSGYEVVIISLKDNNVVYNMDKKIRYIFLPDHSGSSVKVKINRFIDLKNKLIEINPDVVISFWVQPAIFAAILAKFIGFKNIYSERGDPSDKEYSGLLKVLRNIFFRFVDGFVFQTQGAKKCFSKSMQNKGIVINNPVYIKYDDFDIPTKRRKAIVNVGRLHKQKNQKLLIDSFSRISNLFPEYFIEIYGDGCLKDEIENQIKELNMETKIILKGTTNNLMENIVDASLFVLTSDYEGMPNALMEAMALGIPSISTDCKPGGAREIIRNGENGIIVSKGAIDELAEAISFIISNPDKSEEIGKVAKNICNTHSVDEIILKWRKYIEDISEKI